MGRLRLLVVDGNELTRALLRYVLHESPVIEIVGEAVDYRSSVAMIEDIVPDAVVIGEDLPPGDFDLRAVISADFPQLRVIELSALDKAVLQKITGLDPEKPGQNAFDAAILSFSSTPSKACNTSENR